MLTKNGWTFAGRSSGEAPLTAEEAAQKLHQEKQSFADGVYIAGEDGDFQRLRSAETLERLASFEVQGYWNEEALDRVKADQAKTLAALGWQGLGGPTLFHLYEQLNALSPSLRLRDGENTVASVDDPGSPEELEEVGRLYRERLAGSLSPKSCERFFENLLAEEPDLPVSLEGLTYWLDRVEDPTTALNLENQTARLQKWHKIPAGEIRGFASEKLLPMAEAEGWESQEFGPIFNEVFSGREGSPEARLGFVRDLRRICDDMEIIRGGTSLMEMSTPEERALVLRNLEELQNLFPGTSDGARKAITVTARLQKNGKLEKTETEKNFILDIHHKLKPELHEPHTLATEIYYTCGHHPQRQELASRLVDCVHGLHPEEGMQTLIRLESETVARDVELLEELIRLNPERAANDAGFAHDFERFREAEPEFRDRMLRPLAEGKIKLTSLSRIEDEIKGERSQEHIGNLLRLGNGIHVGREYELVLSSKMGQADLTRATDALIALRAPLLEQDGKRKALDQLTEGFRLLDEMNGSLEDAQRYAEIFGKEGVDGLRYALETRAPDPEPERSVEFQENWLSVGDHGLPVAT